MTCFHCGAPMRETIEQHPYASLPGVVLEGVTVRRCSGCGEEEVSIPRIEQLNRVLAQAIIKDPHRLAPQEIRFLRKYLGWSGVDFARHFGVQPETVSRWESGAKAMGPVAERLLRLCVATRSPVDDYDVDDLEQISSEPRERAEYRLQLGGQEWRAAAP